MHEQQEENVDEVREVDRQSPPNRKEDETQASAHRSNWTLVVKVNVDQSI